MNIVTADITPKNGADRIEILPLADLHVGDKTCNTDAIKAELEYIATHENCYTILNGDLLNNATKTSVSDSYSETLSPMEQLKRIIELLEPIKDKILCIQDGNHERRTWRTDGLDISRLIARELGIEDRYSAGMTLLYICLPLSKQRGKSTYSILCTHGCGGGKKVGAKMNRMEDLVNIIDADIYLYSHTHQPAVFYKGYLRTTPNRRAITKVEHVFVNTGAYLDYGGYGEQAEFSPPSLRHPRIQIMACGNRYAEKPIKVNL